MYFLISYRGRTSCADYRRRASLISARVKLVGGPSRIQVGLEEWPSSRESTYFFLPFLFLSFANPLAIRAAPAVRSCYVDVEKREREQGRGQRGGGGGSGRICREESRES